MVIRSSEDNNIVCRDVLRDARRGPSWSLLTWLTPGGTMNVGTLDETPDNIYFLLTLYDWDVTWRRGLHSLVLETIRAVISCELRAKMRLGHTRPRLEQFLPSLVQGHEASMQNIIWLYFRGRLTIIISKSQILCWPTLTASFLAHSPRLLELNCCSPWLLSSSDLYL